MRHQARADSLPELIDLAPADATLVAYADLAALRASPLVQVLAAMAPPSNVDHDYAEFVRATGFDYQKDLDRFVIATRASTAAQTLVFAEGRFDHARIEEYALRSGTLVNQNGHTIYVVPSGTAGKKVSLTFLAGESDRTIRRRRFVDPRWLRGTAPSLDPSLRERLSRVAGSPLFAVAKDRGHCQGQYGRCAHPSWPVRPFASLRWVSLAARPEGAHALLSIEGECDSPADAQKVAGSLEVVRGMLHGGLADPKSRGQMSAETAAAADRMLQGVQVSTDAERVRLLLTLTPELLARPAAPASAHGSAHPVVERLGKCAAVTAHRDVSAPRPTRRVTHRTSVEASIFRELRISPRRLPRYIAGSASD